MSGLQWVCFFEIQGLYAEEARSAGLVPADQPVAVLREGIVYDGCRQAFTAGLILGAPARQALRDVPRALSIDFGQVQAGERCRSWWDRCLRHTPYIEPVEPHQLYLALPTPGTDLTRPLRSEVAELGAASGEFGFVAFVGVASSKLVARAAARACKEGWLLGRPGAAGRAAVPELVAFVRPGEEEQFLAPLPIQSLPAPRDVQRRLARLGLRTIGEAARIPEGEWARQLGPYGRQVALWSRGIDPEQVRPCYPPRSLTRRVQFQPEAEGRGPLEAALARAAAQLARELNGRGEGCQQVSLCLEWADGPPVRVQRTLAKLRQSAWPIQQALDTLLGEALGQGAGPVAALSAKISLIGPMPWQQMDLWEDRARREREERLERALSLLHERFPPRMAGVGKVADVSWREQMLGFSDPYRWGGR